MTNIQSSANMQSARQELNKVINCLFGNAFYFHVIREIKSEETERYNYSQCIYYNPASEQIEFGTLTYDKKKKMYVDF